MDKSIAVQSFSAPQILRASVHQYSLLDALKSLNSAIDKSPALPILANVLIQGAGTILTLSATNLELTQQVQIETRMETSTFEATVPYWTYELLKLLDDARIDLIVDNTENLLTIKQGRYQARLVTIPVDEFPAIDSFDADSSQHLATIINIAELKTVVSHISTFCQKPSKRRGYSSSREYLKLTVDKDGLRLAGANHYAMSSAKLEVDTHITDTIDIYLDPKHFSKAIAVMAGDQENFDVYLTDGNVLALKNGLRTTLIQAAEDVSFTSPDFITVATTEIDYATIAPVLKSAKRNKLLHLDITSYCMTFASDKLSTPIPITFKPVAPTDILMLARNLHLSLKFESTLADFERSLRWRKGTKKEPQIPTLHLMIDPRDDELVLGICGRHNTLDVMSAGIRLSEQGQRWHTFQKMQSLQTRYLEASQLMSVVPTEFVSANVNWFDVPAELKEVRDAKTKQHTIFRDIDAFVAKYPCWTKEDIIAES